MNEDFMTGYGVTAHEMAEANPTSKLAADL